MKKAKRKNHKNGIIVLVLIVCAVIARILSKINFHNIFFGIVRTMIYICLYIGWGISVNKRVMQVQVRKCLVAVSGLTVFWFVIRTMKYFFVSDTDVLRNLWYWYYFPMLFIPLLSVFVAISLGKPDSYRLPKWSSLLYIPTAVCILLVLTNDFHQLVFTFPDGEIWSDKNYEYNVGYCFVIGWEIICALLAFIIMVVKCRLSQRKKYLPVLLLLCSVIYALIYASGVEWMQLIGGDVTAVQCLMFTGILESCIQCGLIQTNTGYGSLFEVGTIKAQIVDNDYNIHYASSNAPLLTKDIMQSAENSAVKLDKNTLLKSSRIDGGYVLWQEDITEITTVLERLEENRKTIAENNDIEQENYKTKVKINAVCEKNRLYNLLQKKTFCQIELLDSLMTQYESETNPQIRRKLLAQSAVIGAYIKRCGNLIFISEKSEVTDTAELSACLDESFANLELMGVECAVDIQDGIKIYTADAIRVYDFFETVTETAVNDICSVWIKSRNCEDCILFYMEMESDIELSQFSALADSCVFDDDVWRFTLRVGKADEQL